MSVCTLRLLSKASRHIIRRNRCFKAKHKYSTEAATQKLSVPAPDGSPKTYSANIAAIVDQISKLTLLEVADLNSCLKSTLNIQDVPMMPMGMAAAAAPAPTEEEEAPAQPVQALFTVKLEKFEDSKKIALIKEMKKVMEGMNLVQAKKFVESAPIVVKAELTKEEAEALQKTLEASGATVTVE